MFDFRYIHCTDRSVNALMLLILLNDLTQNDKGSRHSWHTWYIFYVLLTVHLGIILVNNQLDALFTLFKYVYFTSVHVSSNPVFIIRRINCINTSSGISYHSVYVTAW